LRALSARPLASSSASLLSPSRTYVTRAPLVQRLQQQRASIQAFRFYSDESKPVDNTSEPAAPVDGVAEVIEESVPGIGEAESSAATGSGEPAEQTIATPETEGLSTTIPNPAQASQSRLPELSNVLTSSQAPAVAAATAAASAIASSSSQPSDAQPSQDGQPAPRTVPLNTLYVGNLFFETTEDELRQHFQEFGNIRNLKIIHDRSGLSKG
jgi:hypothetical protein